MILERKKKEKYAEIDDCPYCRERDEVNANKKNRATDTWEL